MKAGEGLGVVVGLQTYGALDLFLQQLQRLCESTVEEKDHTTQYQELVGDAVLLVSRSQTTTSLA